MSSATMLGCRMVLFRRCMQAMLTSVAVQFLLLFVFLLFVNFELLQPLKYITGTLRLVCSFYTWFASIPLIGAVTLYGLSLSQQHLAERRYCGTRYRWLVQNGPRKLFFLAAHLLVGYLTAWLYAGYLQSDYRQLIYSCYGRDCLSSYHLFLLGLGTVVGCYYFVSEHMHQEVTLEYPLVDQTRTEQLRALFYATLRRAPLKSLWPTLSYALIFAVCGSLVKSRLSQLFGVQPDDHLTGFLDMASSGRLLCYSWLLATQILCNMQLMHRLYSLLLAEDLPLVLARNRLTLGNEKELNLVSALGLAHLQVVQSLAAHFIYNAAKRKDSALRSEIFQLTEPGNRPANWRELCDQVLCQLGSFTDELVESMREISTSKGSPQQTADLQGPLLAEKLLLRQYNQLYGIRPAVTPVDNDREQPHGWEANSMSMSGESVRHVPSWCERISLQIETSLQRLFRRIPGIIYFFVEQERAKTMFLLEHSLPLVWLSQALAEICVASLTEDRYGVVQDDLPAIIKALLRLKCELDNLANNVSSLKASNNNNHGSSSTTSFNCLRSAVRRSLFQICNSFYDYLHEIMPPGEELRQLQSFVHHG